MKRVLAESFVYLSGRNMARILVVLFEFYSSDDERLGPGGAGCRAAAGDGVERSPMDYGYKKGFRHIRIGKCWAWERGEDCAVPIA